MMEVLGIDVGGTGIKAGIVDIEKGILTTDRLRMLTPEHARPNDVALVVNEVVKAFKWTGIIGVGFPTIIRNGVSLSAANIDASWIGTDVANLFSSVTGCSVYVVNDADAAGIAEMTFGAGKGRCGVVIMITLGTGIGTAVFVDGKLVPNTEFGHIEIRGKDAETRASTTQREKKNMSYKKWAKLLQEYFSTLEKLLSPDLLIIGGGVSKSADKFLPYIKLRAEIVPAQMRNEAGIIGAAMYAASKAKKI